MFSLTFVKIILEIETDAVCTLALNNAVVFLGYNMEESTCLLSAFGRNKSNKTTVGKFQS